MTQLSTPGASADLAELVARTLRGVMPSRPARPPAGPKAALWGSQIAPPPPDPAIDARALAGLGTNRLRRFVVRLLHDAGTPPSGDLGGHEEFPGDGLPGRRPARLKSVRPRGKFAVSVSVRQR